MSHWPPAVVIGLLVLAVFLPALLVQALGRRMGGSGIASHDPWGRLRRRTRSSLAVFIGLVMAWALYPLVTCSGRPFLGLSASQFVWSVTLLVSLALLVVGAWLWRKK